MKRVLAAMALLASAGALAQAVQDPTRPPDRLLDPAAAGPASGAPQLQSILIGRGAGGRRVAVVDGATVRIGDLVRGARVVGIGQADVQLQRNGKRETLKMTAPDAEPAAPNGKPEQGRPL